MSSFVSLTDLMYPVGSYYISNSSTSPASLFGGEWTQLTDLRVLIGWDAISSGGSGTHAHTYGMKMHSNTGSFCFPSNGGDWEGFYLLDYNDAYIGCSSAVNQTTMYAGVQPAGRYSVPAVEELTAVVHTSSEATYPPYRTCFMWYRTV